MLAPLLLAASLASAQPPAPPRILFLGDSHSAGIFGRELDRLLRRLHQAKVRTHALGGASPWWWFPKSGEFGPKSKWVLFVGEDGKVEPPVMVKNEKGKLEPEKRPTSSFSRLQSQFHPSLVVVALGANEEWSPPQAEKSAKLMSDAIKASGARCIWVGPPRSRDDTKLDSLYSHLKAGISGKCDFVDSRYPWLQFPKGGADTVHYDAHGKEGQDLALRWAQNVYADIRVLLKL